MAILKLYIFFLVAASIAVCGYANHRNSRAAAADPDVLWPDKTIYYSYDAGVTLRLQNTIRQAMDIWESATCLKFVPNDSNEPDYVLFYNYPNEEYCTCNSTGRMGGKQEIILGYSCQTVGDLLHTLGHIIGFYHEQSRPDRDKYIKVLNENIEEGQEKHFATLNQVVTGHQGENYDYASIMHLSATAYSKSGLATTEVINEVEYKAQGSPKLSERSELSAKDILQTNRLYNCPGAGICEKLRVNISGILQMLAEFETDHDMQVVAVDSEGDTVSFSTETQDLNEELYFPINNTVRWQFFRIKIDGNDQGFLPITETFPLKVGVEEALYHGISAEGVIQMNFSYQCIVDEDDCNQNPCLFADECVDELFDYMCHCLQGFGGKSCDVQCSHGYDGYNCDVDISGDSCSPSPCVADNAASCTDGFFDYTCSCITGYGGKNCETQCPLGYDGINCENDISGNSCQPYPCHSWRSLRCIDGVYNYDCLCVPGFGGRNCEIDCPYGFGGFNCDVDISGDSCLSNPCIAANTVSCVDGFFDFSCNCETGYGSKDCSRQCPHGYDGYNCDIDISGDSCTPNPCNAQHTERCTDGFFTYTCKCDPGYGGRNCDTNLCALGYCNNNGGSCIPYRYSPNYKCVCPLAWTPASRCQIWERRCLRVVVKYARGLSDRDGFLAGDSDPYTKITLYSKSGYSTSGKTHYIQGNESPTWNRSFNGRCGEQWERFYFRVYDKDVFSDDALSSGQTVYLEQLDTLPKCSLTVSIVGGSGTITFDVYYYDQGGSGGPGSC